MERSRRILLLEHWSNADSALLVTDCFLIFLIVDYLCESVDFSRIHGFARLVKISKLSGMAISCIFCIV
jgi:hypothetical protein